MTEKENIVLTGDRPTGKLHIGHFVGSIKSRLDLQEKYPSYYMVADVQALTDNAENPDKVRDNVAEVAIDNLACGLDPKKTTFFIQSLIPEIAELTVFFLNLVTVARLERNPTVKEEIKQKFNKSVPAGFFMYPVSQAADILSVKANIIPVGEDQKPMIEQTNEIGEAFNRIYSSVFPHVTAHAGEIKRLPGIDGNEKMGKSLGNAILLSDSKAEIDKKVMSAYTDPKHIHASDPGNVEGNIVFTYLDAFDPNRNEVSELKAQYEKGGLGDVEIKKRLIVILESTLAPIRERREELAKDKSAIMEILFEGTKKARISAQETMAEVREAMKIDYK